MNMSQMTHNDARNFIIALNAISQYVPPMIMQQVTGNPICRVIEHAANTPQEGTTGEQQPPTSTERPRPHAVS